MYDQIPIFIIRQKTAAPFLMRQLLLLHILTYPLFYNNLTGADDAACLYSDDSRSLPLCRYFSFCIDRCHLFIRAAVGDLCLSAGRGELRFDCKGFSFFQCLCRRYSIDAGRGRSLYGHFYRHFFLSGFYGDVRFSGLLRGDRSIL